MTAPAPLALVTGATGFIGGRLVEVLELSGRARVRALVRRFAGASRIARFPIELVGGAAEDPDAIARAVAGADVVYHCAYDWGDHAANIRAARLLGEACLERGVRRLVHLSTISVYEPLPDGPVDETTRAEPGQGPYTDTKIAIEKELLGLHASRGLPVVILQPTIVYGPFGGAWTLAPARRLRKGTILLPAGGEGLANPVYVDDVVQAMVLAASPAGDAALGERLLVSGPGPVTWRAFFGALEEAVGCRGVASVPDGVLRPLAGLAEAAKAGLRRLKPTVKRAAQTLPRERIAGVVRSRRGELIARAIRRGMPPIPYLPSPQLFDLYRAKARVSTARAERLLGYAPRFDLARGMGITAAWLRWANEVER